jgi:SAM-dependent methyltransferase
MSGQTPEDREVKESPEFDDYAEGYAAGMDQSIYRAVGKSPETFIEVKARWLLRSCRDFFRRGPRPDLLDYGCGAGTLLALLARDDFPGTLSGSDISRGMLRQAETRWQGPIPASFHPQQGSLTPFADASFDLVVISSVLHHVMPPDRPEVYAELFRILRPGGRLIVFEHNPYNPVTRWVVSHAEVDRNAILLYPGEVRQGVKAVGARQVTTRYLMFFPPAWRWIRPLEDLLGFVPMGGQYVVTCERVATATGASSKRKVG